MTEKEMIKRMNDKMFHRKHHEHHRNHKRSDHKEVLRYLKHHDNHALSGEIASNVGIITPRLAVILKELEVDGMITRTPLLEDKRKIDVRLTKKAIDKINKDKNSNDILISKLLKRLTEDEIKTLNHILDIIDEIDKEK